MQWSKSPTVESFLNQNGIPFHWEDAFPLSKIDINKSRKNNMRVTTDRILNDVADSYAIAMLDGAEFPGTVAYKNGKAHLFADGNNRIAGMERADLIKPDTVIGCYILDTDDEMLIDLAIRGLNSVNGAGQSSDEKIEQAMAYMAAWPSAKQGEVARKFKISACTLSVAIQAKETADILRERKIDADRLTRTSLTELGKLRISEPAMAIAADVAIAHKLPIAEIKEMVAIAKDKTSDERRVKAIQEFDEKLNSRSPKPVQKPSQHRAAFLRHLRCLRGFARKYPSAEHLHITSKAEREELRRDWDELCEAMEPILG